jgi:hypothetical protein
MPHHERDDIRELHALAVTLILRAEPSVSEITASSYTAGYIEASADLTKVFALDITDAFFRWWYVPRRDDIYDVSPH